MKAFPVVVVDKSFEDGLKALLQCHGIGVMKPNTVLLGWSQDPGKKGIFHTVLRITKKMQRSLLVVRCAQPDKNQIIPSGAINIWWDNQKNGALMLIMAFLLHENLHWRDCPIRILRTISPEADSKNASDKMKQILSAARIEADIKIIPTNKPIDAIKQTIHPSAVLFAGLKPDGDGPESSLTPTNPDVMQLAGDIILVYNAGDMSLAA